MDQHIVLQPTWLIAWVTVLMVMNTASVLFVWKRVEPRWVLVAWLINFPLINGLFATYGYTRILGLSHVIVWTPLLIYLWIKRRDWNVSGSWTGKWLVGLFIVNLISLGVDYWDVFQYVTGNHEIVGAAPTDTTASETALVPGE